MKHVDFLILGGGVTGISFAHFLGSKNHLILEKSSSLGGFCKTVFKDGFVWDYSGHFFHFRFPEIKRILTKSIPDSDLISISKNTKIFFKNSFIDFPFQKNIHQLSKDDFIDCLYDLFFRSGSNSSSFKEMVVSNFGQSISDKFLIPYNEKLYSCNLDILDTDAMGRFFPYANFEDVIANFKKLDNSSYNSEFIYSKKGAFSYVNSLIHETPNLNYSLNEDVIKIDLEKKIVFTSKSSYSFKNLINTIPLNYFVKLCNIPHSKDDFSANKVLVFNLGFDKPSVAKYHWVYFPDKSISFYRVGFYNNILNSNQQSLYVEIGLDSSDNVSVSDSLKLVLSDLKRVGFITDHELISWHHVIMNPAYVHIKKNTKSVLEKIMQFLNSKNAFSIGRYGGWTYCSIEDNIVEAKELVEKIRSFN